MFDATPGGNVTYDTNLVNPNEIKSYWDLLHPKWKGKMVALDPRVASTGTNIRFFYHHPALGPEFIRRLFSEQRITLVRDANKVIDWIAVGKFPIGLLAIRGETAEDQGLPIKKLPSSYLKERL